MISKQVLLGLSLVLGGSVVFYALANNDQQASSQENSAQTAKTEVAKPVVQPLTADVATEEKLLAQKQKEREAHALQLQKHTEQLLAEQELARKNAIDKANAEINGTTTQVAVSGTSASQSELIAVPAVQTRPEAIEAARQAEEAKKAAEEAKKAEEAAKKAAQNKPDTTTDTKKAADAKKAEELKKAEEEKKAQAKRAEDAKKAEAKKAEQAKTAAKGGQYQVQAGETLLGIANRHGVSVQALAAANNMGQGDMLREGRKLTIPAGGKTPKQTQSSNTNKADTKSEKKDDKKADIKKADTKKTDAKSASKNTQNPEMSGRYTVQVAISPDKEKVDKIVKQYRSAGYKVTTTNTSKGVRVVIGNEKTADGAKALRNKISKDGRVSSDGAFIHQVQ